MRIKKGVAIYTYARTQTCKHTYTRKRAQNEAKRIISNRYKHHYDYHTGDVVDYVPEVGVSFALDGVLEEGLQRTQKANHVGRIHLSTTTKKRFYIPQI